MQRQSHGRFSPLQSLILAAMFAVGWSAAAMAQTVVGYSVPSGNGSVGITAGPDGNMWFADFGGNKIGRSTLSGTIMEFSVPTASGEPFAITTGPDGALWFTEFNGNKIGRITTSGTVSNEFVIPTASSIPVSITTGPDGNLWFTESNANKIGQITPAGVITEFTIPTAGSVPNGITAGPDGNLWFTEFHGEKIGRITPSGTFSEFALPSGGFFPAGIVAGPDGALWFTEGFINGQIGRITTSGAITQFPVPMSGGQPGDITVGPDGALWFTDNTSNAVGQITTAGVSSEFTVPVTFPTIIALGPNNALWFSGQSATKIFTFQTAVLTVAESGSGSGQVTSNEPATASGQINCSGSSAQCALTYMTGFPVTLTASAAAGSTFTGWSSGGCTGTAPCAVTMTGNTTVTAGFTLIPSFMLAVTPAGNGTGTVTSNPSGINCGATCTASFQTGTQITLTATAAASSTFAGWSGGGCSGITCSLTISANTTVTPTFVQDSTTNISLVAAVLPLSRSAEVGGTPPTAFATIINAGPSAATACTIAPATTIPASFLFQTTNPMTNALTGTVNTPANIASGAAQSFVIAFNPSAAFAPTNIAFTFACANASPATSLLGVNTLNLSASTTPVPDIVALAASGDPGFVDIPGATGTGVFAVATVNLGTAAQITASANTGTANLPVSLTICQTDPNSGICLATPSANVTTSIAANATPTFGIFATGSATVANLPGVNRVFVTFADGNGVLRGETSVAVRTQ
jgi:streptogramin lyase